MRPFFAFIVLSVLAGLAGCRPAAESPSPAAAPPVTVRVAPVASSTASPLIRVVGVLARQTEADLSFPLPGLLEQVGFRAGDRVSQGQELARLQPDQTEAALLQARALLDKARRDLARFETLQAERVATLEELQDARTRVEQAAAAVRIAEFNRRHSVLLAPADGVVLRRRAEPNELVAAGQPVFSFASAGDGWIARAGLAARDAARIAPGALVELRDGGRGLATGKVIRLGEAADPVTRTIPVEILLDAPPAYARSGQVTSLAITPEPVPARTVVPLAALREGRGSAAVLFVLEPGGAVARRVAVEVEQIDGELAYLRTPLAPGHRVIVAGVQFVHDGAPVSVDETDRAAR